MKLNFPYSWSYLNRRIIFYILWYFECSIKLSVTNVLIGKKFNFWVLFSLQLLSTIIMIFILYLFLLIYLFSPDTNIFFSFFVPSFSLSIIIASLHISVFLCLNYVYIYAFEFFNHYLAYIRQGGGGDDYDDDNGDEMIAPLILIQRHCSTRLRCHSWVFIRFSRFSVPFSCFQFFSLCWKTRYPIWNSLSNQTKRTFFKIRFWKLRRV